MAGLRLPVRLLFLILWLLCGRGPVASTPETKLDEPTNSWAVQVRGGSEVADRLAEKHGFKNMGQVSAAADSCIRIL